MPIYEFLCTPCNTIFSFHSFRVNPEKVPVCPRCGDGDMRRVPSRFGVSATRKSAEVPGSAAGGSGGDDTVDDPRTERELMKLAAELESMDESDPRQMAAAVRRMTEIAGEPVTPAMEEMIRRLEAGEDPERIEEDLGDALEDEMGGDGDGGSGMAGAPRRDEGLYPL